MSFVMGFHFESQDHPICNSFCSRLQCGTCWLRPVEHLRTRCAALLSYLSNIQPQPNMTHCAGIRTCKSSCWCTSCGACWNLDSYHGARNCPFHKQVKNMMSYNENHNTRMEEARQPSEEDVPMLAIGHSSLWSNDRDMSAISEGSLEL